MNTMNVKEVLRAIADGADPSEFEWLNSRNDWVKLSPSGWILQDFFHPKNQFRRKPRTRVVNGYTVPAPIHEMPEKGTRFFLAVCLYQPWHTESTWIDDYTDRQWFERGLLFSTKEAAIANAKAMCGIDPSTN